MPDFTPGLWEVDPKRRLRVRTKERDLTIASTGTTDSLRDSWEANANLIAAAPEMYEALIGCLHYIEHSMTAKDKVRAALAKADGKE